MTKPLRITKAVRRHKAPAWWSDAKLGIFVHWTPASIPAFAPVESSVGELLASGRTDAMAHVPYAEWYENSLRFAGSPVARHHAATYGNKDYKEFAGEWEAALSLWDPGLWAEQFARAGARYVVLVAKHHDGYCLWPTAIANPHRPGWNCRRDVVGEMAEAVRGAGMRFGLYYSGGLDWTFDSRPIGTFSDLLAAVPGGGYGAYADAHVRELVERYQPSVLWNDIAWPQPAEKLAALFADYYRQVPDGAVNDRFMPVSWLWAAARTRPGSRLLDSAVSRSAKTDKGVVPPRPPMYDFRTPEYTVFPGIQRDPWECVRGMDSGFGHNRQSNEADFLTQSDLAWSLLDVVSKGGNLLLNVGPRGDDAAIPEVQGKRLEWLAELMAVAGPSLRATRPWVVPGSTDGSCEVRYAARDQTVFAFVRPVGSTPIERVVLPDVLSDPAAAVTDGAGRVLTSRPAGVGLEVDLASPATPEHPAVIALTGVPEPVKGFETRFLRIF